MTLSDRLHCPDCYGRLAATEAGWQCIHCDRTILALDGIADFTVASDTDHPGLRLPMGLLPVPSPANLKAASGDHWPTILGDVVEFGCGMGELTTVLASEVTTRNLLILDGDLQALQACQVHLQSMSSRAGQDQEASRPEENIAAYSAESLSACCAERLADNRVLFAALTPDRNAIRDATADTVFSTACLAAVTDVRAFLTAVYRALRPNGRALLVLPNRRYHQIIADAVADALTRFHARQGAWPEGLNAVLRRLADIRRLLITRYPASSPDAIEKHLFDTDTLEELAREIGFARADIVSMNPDPASVVIAEFCRDSGMPEDAIRTVTPLALASARTALDLLRNQDRAAYGLLDLAKAPGPAVRNFASRPAQPLRIPADAVHADPPHWSLELTALDTPDGIVVTINGWCLSNVLVKAARVALAGVGRLAVPWQPRADVHEVMNRARLYHPLHALCCGIEQELLFPGIHPDNQSCPLHLDFLLEGNVTVTAPAPSRLVMHERTVITH